MVLPSSRPKEVRKSIEKLLNGLAVLDEAVIVGIRGYYLNSMGVKGKNDRGIYDDAIFVISPSVFASFNANTDPSIYRKGVAVLKPGVYRYKKGKHGISRGQGYPALRPATEGEKLPVSRDGLGDSFGVAINIHKGNIKTTSSLGCQTIYPIQWTGFINLVYEQMDRYKQKTIPYILAENK
jgi:lysozyme